MFKNAASSRSLEKLPYNIASPLSTSASWLCCALGEGARPLEWRKTVGVEVLVGSSCPAGAVLSHVPCVVLRSCACVLMNGELVASDEHHCKAWLMKTSHRVIRFSKREHGMPKKFEFSDNHIPYTYTNKWFIVYLKIKYNWASCIPSGNPVFMQDHLCPLLMVSSPLLSSHGQISEPHWICECILSNNIDLCECGVYSWPHDHLIWFVDLYYAALYYSVWHGKDSRI